MKAKKIIFKIASIIWEIISAIFQLGAMTVATCAALVTNILDDIADTAHKAANSILNTVRE